MFMQPRTRCANIRARGVLISASCVARSYMIEDGICYLTLTDKTYPKRLAFLFLEDISREFVLDLKSEHGDRYEHIA